MKKRIIIGIFSVLVLSLVLFGYPYFRLLTSLHSLTTGNIEYSVELYENSGENEFVESDLVLTGYKTAEMITSKMDGKNHEFLYMERESKEIVLNMADLISYMLQNTEDNWLTQSIDTYLGNVYITSEQLQTILGDYDFLIPKHIAGLFASDEEITEQVDLKMVECPEEFQLDGMYSYQLEGLEEDMEIYLAVDKVPKDKRIVLIIKGDESISKIVLNYKPVGQVELHMPDSLASDDVLHILKKAYELYERM